MKSSDAVEKGYKVVLLDRHSGTERFLSASIYAPKARAIYGIGRTTVPNTGCGPLCVFQTKRQAEIFASNLPAFTWLIMPCEFEPAREDQVWICGDHITEIGSLPEGTMLAKSVTLLEEEV